MKTSIKFRRQLLKFRLQLMDFGNFLAPFWQHFTNTVGTGRVISFL